MSNRFIQYGFTAGTVSEPLWGQTILQKYGYGLALCDNFIITNLGGLVTRGGYIAGTLLPLPLASSYRLAEFNFAKDTANTFGLLFVDEKIYFMQGGAWQLDDAVAISAVSSTSTETTVTATSHGLSVGDYVEFTGVAVPAELYGQTVIVSAVNSADEFEVQQLELSKGMDSWTDATLTGGASVNPLYNITAPYTESDLAELYFSQTRDEIKIYHKDYATRALVREEDGTWTLTEIDFSISIARPSAVNFVGITASDAYAVLFAVTAVNEDKEESLPQYMYYYGVSNYVASPNHTISISWTPVADATEYYIYRSLVRHLRLTKGAELGYCTKTTGLSFTDSDYAPDFGKAPPKVNTPFSPGRVKRIDVTSGGTLYDVDDTVAISGGGGTGFIGVPIIERVSGVIEGIDILDPGSGYSSGGSLVMTTSTGSGFTGTIVLAEETGTYPRVGVTHKQRAYYAATENESMRVWASRIGLLNNMGFSDVVAADEGFSYQLDAELYGTIKHLVGSVVGILAFTDVGIWTITGSNGSPKPTDVDSEEQTSLGCNNLKPLKIDNDIVYMEAFNTAIRLLQFNDYSKNYGGRELTILASELLSAGQSFSSWGFCYYPYRVITAVREDQTILTGTIDREQEVFAFGSFSTTGGFEHNIVLQEDDRPVEYVVCRRYLSGRWVRTIEYASMRVGSTREMHCGVDCSVSFGYNLGAGDISFDGTTVTTTSNNFSAGSVGLYIRFKELKLLITTYNSASSVDVTIVDDKPDWYIETLGVYKTIHAGKWYLSEKVSSITLPLNFRPAAVSVYGDGNTESAVVPSAAGVVTFAEEYSIGWVGLPFSCVAKTLPLQVQGALVEASVKAIREVGLRYYKSKAIKVGTSLDDLYPIHEVTHDVSGESNVLVSDFESVAVSSDWEVSVGSYIVVDTPAPAHITSTVLLAEVGDAI